MLSLLGIALVAACSVSAGAATYYVSPTGKDTNAGTSTAPFLTIQHAADLVKAGDTVIVRQGTYAGIVMGWDTPTAGTASARITFQADPTAPAGSVVINKGNSKTHVGFDLEPGCDYITIDGFVVDGSGGIANYPTRGSGIKVTGDYDIVRNCTVKNIDYGFGVFADSAVGVVIQNNNIYNINWGSAQNGLFGHGIYVSGNSTGAQVRGNLVHDNAYIGIHINGDIGDSGAPGLVQSAVIENNIVYNNGQNALNCDGLQGSIVRNNLFYGYQGFAICLYTIDAGGPSKNNLIANNTMVTLFSGSAAALRIKDGATGNQVLNNVLLGGDGNSYRISSDSLPGLVSDYNVVSNNFQSEDSGASQTLASWRTSTGQDKHSFTATAASLFLSLLTNDFHLSSSSPAVDKGMALSQVTTDLFGNPRPMGLGQDIGCIEFLGQVSPPSPPSPPALSSLAVSPASVIGGGSATATVTLTTSAPTGGIVVALSSSNASAAKVPSSVTVAAGASSATFAVTTTALSADASVTLSATYSGATKTAALTVQAPALSSITLNPTSVSGGASSTATVTLTGPAPTNGLTVNLSSNSASAIVPASVTVPAGSSSASFTVSTKAVSTNTTAALTATLGGSSKSANLVVNAPAAPATLSSVSVNPSFVTGGSSTTGTVTLTAAAPAGGCLVSLACPGSAAKIPASITVPAGSSSATFAISTTSVAVTTSAVISATAAGATKSASFTITNAAQARFVMGVNLGGAATVIEGNQWLSYSAAKLTGLSCSGSTWVNNPMFTPAPAVDASTKTMLNSMVFRYASNPGEGFKITQTLPNGNYSVYLWGAEDDASNSRDYDVKVQGTTVATRIGDLPLNQWRKYGPYACTVSNGVLTIDVLRSTKGNPQIMGMAIFTR